MPEGEHRPLGAEGALGLGWGCSGTQQFGFTSAGFQRESSCTHRLTCLCPLTWAQACGLLREKPFKMTLALSLFFLCRPRGCPVPPFLPLPSYFASCYEENNKTAFWRGEALAAEHL